MHMTFASTLRRLAFAPLPAPPGFFALPLRLMVGYGFLEHGYAKLARGPNVFIGILHAIGVPFSFFLGWATILIEVIGGLLILCGAFVPLAPVPIIVVLLVAIFTVHLPNGFSSIKLLSYDASGAHFGQPGRCRSMVVSAHAGEQNGSATPDQGRVPDREAGSV
jgi:putative oxidoreductase